MAVSKHETMGLMRDLKAARAKALVHPDSDVYTTAAAAIAVIIADLITAGASAEG
jgi:hypothetical protein